MTIRHTDRAGEKCILNKTKSSKKIIILLSVIAAVLAVILCVLLIMIAAGKMSAVTIRLSDYTGEISLTDKAGKDIPVSEDKRLSDGNTLSTYEESRARVLLDEDRAVTLMELSSALFRGKGKKLALELSEGSLFFNIEKPLGDDEAFEISTSTMIIGIRGTSGFVDTDENGNEVLYMTSGKVSVTVTDPGSDDDETEKVKAGEKLTVIITEDGIDTVIEEFSEYELPFDALTEILGDPDLFDIVIDETGWDAELLRNRLSDAGTDEDENILVVSHNTAGISAIPETVVDGVIHHAYFRYDYPDEFCGFMDRLIETCRGGNFEAIGEVCGYDNSNQDEIAYVQTYIETEIEQGSEVERTYRFLYEDYRCVIQPHTYSDSYKYIDVWLIPDEGEGYGTYVACGGSDWNGFHFVTGECANGIFEGTFHRHGVAVYHNDDDFVRVSDYNGTVKNGLMDGVCTINFSDTENTTYYVYENGLRTAHWYQQPGSDEKINYKSITLEMYFMVGEFQCVPTQHDNATDMYPF